MYRLRTGYVRNKVKSGRYNNASEVVREALRRMEDQDARAVRLAKPSAEDIGVAMPTRGLRACGGVRAKRFGANRRPGRQSASRRQGAVRRAQIHTRCD